MLILRIGDIEVFDEETAMFDVVEGKEFRLEHSLYAIAKWESKYLKPFLSKDSHTAEEMMDYFDFMSLNGELPREEMTQSDTQKIIDYIQNPATATTIKPSEKSSRSRTITSEVVYAQMVEAKIPFECQYWHLNRLLTLLAVIAERANPKKINRHEIMRRNTELNAQRKAKLNTRG